MTAIPTPERTTATAIMQHYVDTADNGHRPHLGASIIGHPCDRNLWLTFHWAKAQAWEGRMLRLFDDGKRAELRFVTELRAIGCEVWEHDAAGQQFRVSAHGGHFGGSVDAVVQGIPEAPKTPHVAEFKTSNDKLFKSLMKHGVRKEKPLHFAQMQVYMGLLNLERALYLVENKNDAALYVERVDFDATEYERIYVRAGRVIAASEPPPKIADTAEHLTCKWCSFSPVCHGQEVPEVNCRTCAYGTADLTGDAQWTCERSFKPAPLALQRLGCDGHRFIPALLRNIAEPIDSNGDDVQYRMADGSVFINGPAPAFSSREIRDAKYKTMLGDEFVQDAKAQVPSCTLIG